MRFPIASSAAQVQQVRLSATNTNNVITYPVVVAVDNRDEVLLPGMTANAEIEVSRRDGVLKLPNAALRFKPAEDAIGATRRATQAARRASRHGDDLPKLAASLQLNAAQQAAFDDALDADARAHGRAPGAGGDAARRRQQPVRPRPGRRRFGGGNNAAAAA